MKKFIFKLVLFLLPTLIGIGYILFSATPKKFAYHYLKGNCSNKAAWIYWRIFEAQTPIDIAILGSSRSLHAINDSLLEDNLNQTLEKPIHVANLGYCGMGRDLSFTFLQDLVAHKKVKSILIEVTENEESTGHLMNGYVANTNEIFSIQPQFNKRYFLNLYDAFLTKWEEKKRYLLHTPYLMVEMNKPNYGSWQSDRIENPAILEAVQKEQKPQTEKPYFYDFNTNYSNVYLQKIADLAKANKIQITFFYVPKYINTYQEYGMPVPEPFSKEIYLQYGKLLSPNVLSFSNPSYWLDKDHLNDNGEKIYRNWLVPELTSILMLN